MIQNRCLTSAFPQIIFVVGELSVPWSLRPRNRGCGDCGRGCCEHRCGYRNLRRRFFLGEWLVRRKSHWTMRRCAELPSRNLTKTSFPVGASNMGPGFLSLAWRRWPHGWRIGLGWRISGDFLAILSAARDPKLTCLRRGSVLSCLRCVFAQPFCCHKSFWEIAPNYPKQL